MGTHSWIGCAKSWTDRGLRCLRQSLSFFFSFKVTSTPKGIFRVVQISTNQTEYTQQNLWSVNGLRSQYVLEHDSHLLRFRPTSLISLMVSFGKWFFGSSSLAYRTEQQPSIEPIHNENNAFPVKLSLNVVHQLSAWKSLRLLCNAFACQTSSVLRVCLLLSREGYSIRNNKGFE